MSPSARFLGSNERVNAILDHRAIYEIGGELETDHVIGRRPAHPPYVLLAFAVLGRMSRSTVRTETDLMNPSNWIAVRNRMVQTIHRHNLDLPLPPRQPPAWHHWRRFREENLITDEGIATLRSLHLAQAARLAHELGLLIPTHPESLTHPSRERVLYGDGTIVRPIYQPPDAVRTLDDDGDPVIRYPSKSSGELLDEPDRRYDPDLAEHHGHRGPVLGHGYVAFHARGKGTYRRVTLTIDHIPQPGQEADTAVRLVGDLHRVIGQGAQIVVYDGALRGTHIDQIMRRAGYLVISKQPQYDATDDPATTTMVKGPRGIRLPSLTLGPATHMTPTGTCTHILAAVGGRVVEIELDDTGDPTIANEPERSAIKRSRRNNGNYAFNIGYKIPCAADPFTVWLSPHARNDGDPRPEHLRPFPQGDPDHTNIVGIRSDAEGVHSQYKRTLLTERAMSLGWRRGLIDYYAFALYSNAMAEFKNAAQPTAPTARLFLVGGRAMGASRS